MYEIRRKIEKKHGIEIAYFLGMFIEEGFKPYNDAEADLIRKWFGFARHHALFDDASLNHFAQKIGLAAIKARARMDMSKSDITALLEMIEEVFDDRGDKEMPKELKSTERYLKKTLEQQDAAR
jgi:hypothetical protein